LQQSAGTLAERGVDVFLVERAGRSAVQAAAQKLGLSFPLVADPHGQLGATFGQQQRFPIGRLPAVFAVDGEGRLLLVHYGTTMRDYPRPEDLLAAFPAPIGPAP
jgi:peroxiredoxin